MSQHHRKQQQAARTRVKDEHDGNVISSLLSLKRSIVEQIQQQNSFTTIDCSSKPTVKRRRAGRRPNEAQGQQNYKGAVREEGAAASQQVQSGPLTALSQAAAAVAAGYEGAAQGEGAGLQESGSLGLSSRFDWTKDDDGDSTISSMSSADTTVVTSVPYPPPACPGATCFTPGNWVQQNLSKPHHHHMSHSTMTMIMPRSTFCSPASLCSIPTRKSKEKKKKGRKSKHPLLQLQQQWFAPGLAFVCWNHPLISSKLPQPPTALSSFTRPLYVRDMPSLAPIPPPSSSSSANATAVL